MKTVELYRHTANDGDVLTPEGIQTAVEIGRELTGSYVFLVSSGAQRATQTAACFLAGLGESVPGGIVVSEGLRSKREDDWYAAYQRAGAGDLEALRQADPELVKEDSKALAAGIRGVFRLLDEGARALAVGHSPTNEAAVLGLTGELIPPLGKGEGVVVIQDGNSYAVARQ